MNKKYLRNSKRNDIRTQQNYMTSIIYITMRANKMADKDFNRFFGDANASHRNKRR
ncbi:hypothetical protein C5S53_08775 [Methanophagales archaeon]|nr:hypothetical protein C5S53_08775 [Methanophagales archaeon]